jgi:hypothetical protein
MAQATFCSPNSHGCEGPGARGPASSSGPAHPSFASRMPRSAGSCPYRRGPQGGAPTPCKGRFRPVFVLSWDGDGATFPVVARDGFGFTGWRKIDSPSPTREMWRGQRPTCRECAVWVQADTGSPRDMEGAGGPSPTLSAWSNPGRDSSMTRSPFTAVLSRWTNEDRVLADHGRRLLIAEREGGSGWQAQWRRAGGCASTRRRQTFAVRRWGSAGASFGRKSSPRSGPPGQIPPRSGWPFEWLLAPVFGRNSS